jgi:hypothetical protein
MTPCVASIRPEFLLPVIIVPVLYFATELALLHQRKDKFLARLFSEYRDLWDALGGPRGWQWAPPRGEEPPVNSSSIYFDWLYRCEPSWIADKPELQADYRFVRRGLRRWSFVAIPIIGGRHFCSFCSSNSRSEQRTHTELDF